MASNRLRVIDFCSIAECADLLSLIEPSELWQPVLVPSKDPSKYFDKRKQDVIKHDSMTEQMKLALSPIISRAVTRFCELRFARGKFQMFHVGIKQFQRSKPGDYFSFHKDAPKFEEIGIIYLSDSDSHGLRGGQTIFRIDGEQIEVAPKQGKACFFDASIVHKGAKVLGGFKYSLVVGTVAGPAPEGDPAPSM